MKMAVFCDVALYILVEVDRCFRGAYCPITLTIEAVSTSEMLVTF
jgi:hypothetical protein